MQPFESAFLEEKKEICHNRAKWMLLFGIILVPLFNGLDYIVAPEHFRQFFYLRLINTFENLVLLFILFFHKKLSLRWVNVVASLFCCSVGPMIAYMCRSLGGYESSYYAGIMLLFLLIGLIMPWQTRYTLFNCLFNYLAYVLIAYAPASSFKNLINNSYFLLSAMLMGLASTYLGEKLRFKEFKNRQELKDANERLLSLDQAKTRFFANMTHEFRTPLVSLDAVLQMIEEKMASDTELSPLLKSSHTSLIGMIENINDLLNRTKAEQDMLQMRWSHLDIIELMRKTIEVFKPLAAKQKTRLAFINELRSPDGEFLTSFFVYADRSKIRKILSNLVGNAVKFTQGGKIEVQLETSATNLIFKVQDTGIGIPQSELPTIFNPFTQGSNNPLRDVQGTGLGLSIVEDFVKAHHGEVSVASTPGQGSLFTVLLPLGDANVDKAHLDWSDLIEENSLVSPLETIPSFEEMDLSLFSQHSPERFNILLIEDTPQVLEVLAYVLKDEYNLYFAKDGEEGLAQIHKLQPDLIISDIMMPKKNGYELLAEVKKDPELRIIPFILLTAKVDLPSKLQGLAEGADEYISKPFNNAEIRTRVKNLLERSRIQQEFIHAKNMIDLGLLTAGVSHEILNPISYARNANENVFEFMAAIRNGSISEEEGNQQIEASVIRTRDGILRVCEIVAALRSLLRQGSRGFNFYDIHEGIDASIKIFLANYKTRIQIHRQYDLQGKVDCKINQLNQVFLNLLSNAAEAMQNQLDGNIWIRTYQEKEKAIITVRDDGPGIPKGLQPKIFKAFFTRKDVGQGMGLGLYISWQIVQEHRGQILVESSPGKGTQFTIEIPLQQPTGGPNDESFHDRIDRRVAEVRYPDC